MPVSSFFYHAGTVRNSRWAFLVVICTTLFFFGVVYLIGPTEFDIGMMGPFLDIRFGDLRWNTEEPRDTVEPVKDWNPREELSRGYSRVPFPIEDVDKLPVAFATTQSCKRRLGCIFFVHSAAKHQRARGILRQALGKSAPSTRYNWTTVFFVGLASDQKTRDKVSAEAARYGDIVVLPYLDTYRNLTYKFVYGIKWTMDNCGSAEYITKIDDDMVVNLVGLFSYFVEISEENHPQLHCDVIQGGPVIREKDSPWYLSKSVYPKDTFPDYCSGRVVLLRRDLLGQLYNASFAVPFFEVDDAYVTGEAARVANVGHVSLNQNIHNWDGGWGPVAKGVVTFSHISKPEFRQLAWNAIVKQLEK